jgi:hypothetical protein
VLSGKSGTFVLEDIGTFDGGEARSQLRIVEGSATGQLERIQGTGFYRADKKSFHWELEYDFH